METCDSRSCSRRKAPMAMRKSEALGDITNLAAFSSTAVYSRKKPRKAGEPRLGSAKAADPDGIGIQKRVPADPVITTREKSEAPEMSSQVSRKKGEFSKRKCVEIREVPEQKSDSRTDKSVVCREKFVLEQKLEDHRKKSILSEAQYEFVRETSVVSEQKYEVPKENIDLFEEEATVRKTKSAASKEKFEALGASMRHCIRNRGDKEKAADVVGHLSCPPLTRIRDLMNKTEMANGDIFSSKASSIPLPKPKKKRRYTTSDVQLPRDFIEKQKAYFAEIDAFELPEEIASESESEDEPTTEFAAELESKLEETSRTGVFLI